MFTVKDGKARRNTKPTTQQQRTWRLIFSYTVMIPITDSRSRMWRCSLEIGLLSLFFFLPFSLVCLFVWLFLSFFLREYLALFLSLCFPAASWWWVVPFGITKTRARATKWWKECKGRRKESIKAQKHLKRSCAHDTPSPPPLLPPFFLTCSRYSR